MKSIFCAGNINLNKDKSLNLNERLKEDYRVYLLKDINKLIYSNKDSIILDKFKYNGTF